MDNTIDTPDSPARTPTGAPAGRASRAHVFFWIVLAAAATISITGNATQALLHHTALPAVAAAVAIIPPLALLAAVHGVSVLSRAHTATRATRTTATAMTVLIATGAFWLSFTALRALAITAGIPAAEAWVWPLIIEGSMAQSTVALLALAHSTHPSNPPEPSGHTTAHPLPTAATVTATDHPAPPVATEAVAPADVRTPPQTSSLSDSDLADLASRLCARDPARRRNPDLVTQALHHHHRDGWNPTRIAHHLNKSRSTISRILTEAAGLTTDPLRQQQPASKAPTPVISSG